MSHLVLNALQAGRGGGAIVADEIARLVGPDANLAHVSEALREAAMILQSQARVGPASAECSQVPLPLPGARLVIGQRDEIPHEILGFVQNHWCAMRSSHSKLALACTCKAWSVALQHPAFWTDLDLPSPVWGERLLIKDAAHVLAFINANPQRWALTCSVNIHYGGAQKAGKPLLTRLKELMPKLTKFTALATGATPAQRRGDDLLEALAESGLGKQLKCLSLLGLRLSSRHLIYFHAPPPQPHPPQLYNAFPLLSQLELFNIPCEAHPQANLEGFFQQVPFPRTLDPANVAMKIIRGCAKLLVFDLMNPADAMSRCSLDVEAARLGLPCIADPAKYAAHRASLPPVPAVGTGGSRHRRHWRGVVYW
mmetsp:Transcript_34016/g.56330  ORF Transcript_34016/g.56330 Transcript_34016/m.56330 type:complete len:368 (+) Transcript_34016:67-1170(+)